jgi:hypothetical protein
MLDPWFSVSRFPEIWLFLGAKHIKKRCQMSIGNFKCCIQTRIYNDIGTLYILNHDTIQPHQWSHHYFKRRDHRLKTVYCSEDNAIFSFEIQDLTDPAISNYTALQLLDSGEGQATCLLCRKTYGADQLTRFAIGAGDSPFNVQIRPLGIRDSLFGGKRHMHSMLGGKGFRCPAGHKLISAVTWIS